MNIRELIEDCGEISRRLERLARAEKAFAELKSNCHFTEGSRVYLPGERIRDGTVFCENRYWFDLLEKELG